MTRKMFIKGALMAAVYLLIAGNGSTESEAEIGPVYIKRGRALE